MSLFLFLAGAASHAWQMMFMALVLLLLPAVSLAMAYRSLTGVTVTREAPPVLWTHQPNHTILKVRVNGLWPRLGVIVQERDRRLEAEPVVFDLYPGRVNEVEHIITPLLRGVYMSPPVELIAYDPMGLAPVKRVVPADGELVVCPTPEPVPELIMSGTEHTLSVSSRATITKGGIDPHGVREYVPGDPLRRMHWKTVARTGALHVVEYDEPRSHSVTLVLDGYYGSQYGDEIDNTFEYLVRAVASYARQVVDQRASVRLVCTNGEALRTRSGKSREHLMYLLRLLAEVQPTGKTRLAAALWGHQALASSRSSVYMFTSDTDPALIDAAAHLTARGGRVAIIWADPTAVMGPSVGRDGDKSVGAVVQEARGFLERLAGSGLPAWRVHQTEEGLLALEPVSGRTIHGRRYETSRRT